MRTRAYPYAGRVHVIDHVEKPRQGKGLGSGLLKDAMLRTLQAADIAGIRALAVHAKDDDARAFDERFGFTAAPTDAYHQFVLLKDVRAILKQRYNIGPTRADA